MSHCPAGSLHLHWFRRARLLSSHVLLEGSRPFFVILRNGEGVDGVEATCHHMSSLPEVNYMSTLSFDRHPAVRRFWFETLAYWMLRCVDKAG